LKLGYTQVNGTSFYYSLELRSGVLISDEGYLEFYNSQNIRSGAFEAVRGLYVEKHLSGVHPRFVTQSLHSVTQIAGSGSYHWLSQEELAGVQEKFIQGTPVEQLTTAGFVPLGSPAAFGFISGIVPQYYMIALPGADKIESIWFLEQYIGNLQMMSHLEIT